MAQHTSRTVYYNSNEILLLEHCASEGMVQCQSSSALPQEVLEAIFNELPKLDQASAARACTVFRLPATRKLYRNIVGLNPQQLVRCLRSLSRYSNGTTHVRRLEVVWSAQYPLRTSAALVHRVLKRLPNLRVLSLDFPPEVLDESFGWMLRGLPCSLTTLTTSFRAGPALATFLETQPSLTELCLRGFSDPCNFPLSQTALPSLHSFRALHVGRGLLRTIAKGRPLVNVTLSLPLEHSSVLLEELQHSTKPMERLTLMGLNLTNPVELVSEIARQMPGLEGFHVFVLILSHTNSEHTKNELLEVAGPLRKFTNLRYLTLMAGGSAHALTDDDEREIASTWAKDMPNIQTIILPRGKVWFQRNDQWTHMDIDDLGL